MVLASRGESLGFAERCRKNLLHIEEAYQRGCDVHVVTQIISSSLGLVVFPWEKKADLRIRGTLLSELDKLGWPHWEETKPSKGLGQLIHSIRNAVAHGNIHFSSDDRDMSEVIVTFGSKDGDWEARISARGLRGFCFRFIDLIESEIA